MKKPRLYLDTSIFGGHFDPEFEDHTAPLFERISNGDFIVLLSTVTEEELKPAPEKIKRLASELNAKTTEFLEASNESVDLALEYISENVVGMTSYSDCLHIAIATIHNADVLVSWNFKHIVNVERIRGYNSINIKNGYRELDIRSPRELLSYENED